MHGVGTFGEVGEVHDGFVAEVGVGDHLLPKGVVDGYAADVLGTLDVELTDSGVGVEGDIGTLGTVDAHKGDDSNPARVVAGVAVVVEGCLERDVDVALDVGYAEGVGGRGLVAIGPFIGGSGGAGGVEDGGLAGFEVPFAVDGGDDGGFLEGEHEYHHAVAAEGVGAEGIGGCFLGHIIIGAVVEVPVEAVASVDIGGVVAGFVDGDVDGDGAVVASSPTTVGEHGVEVAALGEALGGGAYQGADGEEHVVAAFEGSVANGGAGSFDVEGDGAVGDAMGGAVGVEDAVDTALSVFVATPGLGGAGGIVDHGGAVDDDAEGELVEGVAVDFGVLNQVGVSAGGGEEGVVPVVVAAVAHNLVDVDGGNQIEVQHIDMGAVVGDDSVAVDTGLEEGVAFPYVLAAGVDGLGIGLGVGEGQRQVEDAVAKTGTDGGKDGVAIHACLGVGFTAPVVGAAGADDGLVGDEGVVDGEVEDEQRVVGGVDVVNHGVVGVCLPVNPFEGSTYG